MSTAVVLIVCALPLIGLFVLLATHQKRQEARAMRDFAALLEGGVFRAGDMRRGPRATGRWKGVDVEVGFFARLEPPVFLTAVTAARRRGSPVAALLVPRSNRRVPGEPPPSDAPEWLRRLDRMYDADCAPKEMFRAIVDATTAESLTGLERTEIEILPNNVNVQRREILYEASQLVPLLDAAVQLLARLDAVHEQLAGVSEAEANRRAGEVTKLLNAFRR